MTVYTQFRIICFFLYLLKQLKGLQNIAMFLFCCRFISRSYFVYMQNMPVPRFSLKIRGTVAEAVAQPVIGFYHKILQTLNCRKLLNPKQ